MPLPEISFTIGATSFTASYESDLHVSGLRLDPEGAEIDDAKRLEGELDGGRVERRVEGDVNGVRDLMSDE